MVIKTIGGRVHDFVESQIDDENQYVARQVDAENYGVCICDKQINTDTKPASANESIAVICSSSPVGCTTNGAQIAPTTTVVTQAVFKDNLQLGGSQDNLQLRCNSQIRPICSKLTASFPIRQVTPSKFSSFEGANQLDVSLAWLNMLNCRKTQSSRKRNFSSIDAGRGMGSGKFSTVTKCNPKTLKGTNTSNKSLTTVSYRASRSMTEFFQAHHRLSTNPSSSSTSFVTFQSTTHCCLCKQNAPSDCRGPVTRKSSG